MDPPKYFVLTPDKKEIDWLILKVDTNAKLEERLSEISCVNYNVGIIYYDGRKGWDKGVAHYEIPLDPWNRIILGIDKERNLKLLQDPKEDFEVTIKEINDIRAEALREYKDPVLLAIGYIACS